MLPIQCNVFIYCVRVSPLLYCRWLYMCVYLWTLHFPNYLSILAPLWQNLIYCIFISLSIRYLYLQVLQNSPLPLKIVPVIPGSLMSLNILELVCQFPENHQLGFWLRLHCIEYSGRKWHLCNINSSSPETWYIPPCISFIFPSIYIVCF